ncbi:MAG: rhodanese-like domain-containing protein [Verrucomicrobiota bacterium]
MTVQELKERIDREDAFRLIDVREKDEWELCHLADAELIPLSNWDARWEIAFRDSGEDIVVYCHHGGRSGSVVKFLESEGFTNVKNLEGGIDAWSRWIDPEVPRY